ncbi:hypothetical protein L211DRAFT_868892 [Terfezia boudieri ATCC MYA-4762]|uniref:AP complex mu/sigma subunit domain-containing protein n=1 Tax=Terfezia boudieri ATCC MYA-4762 TaxID=1051890 RepID=A0A3N4LN32_9PEZI|nr:hypothetical protein L211DRAFT_868892 [Terfezia boudieri ATCC MYA-4762]
MSAVEYGTPCPTSLIITCKDDQRGPDIQQRWPTPPDQILLPRRMSPSYPPPSPAQDISLQQRLLSEIFSLVSTRPPSACNFLPLPPLLTSTQSAFSSPTSSSLAPEPIQIIYRHYATLFFIIICDGAESELGLLDLIQVFVEALDRVFENVCELDLIFNFEVLHQVLAEVIQGGCVVETDIGRIVAAETGDAHNLHTVYFSWQADKYYRYNYTSHASTDGW